MKKLIVIIVLSLTCSASMRLCAQNLPHRVARETMTDLIQNIGDQVPNAMNIAVDGVPFLGIQAGASLQFGEFARLRTCFPGMTGFTLLGGIGKELIFKHDYNDRLLWHAGIGYYWSDGPTTIFSAEILAVRSPSISDVGILLNGEFNWFFEKHKRLGAFLGFGVGLGELDRNDPKALWEVSLGLSFKIFRK